MKRWLRHSLPLICLVLVAALVASACGGDNEEKTASPTKAPAGSPTASLSAGVPELSDGTLQVGSDIAYAPIEFYEEGTQNATGLDVDMANALAKELGVKAEFQNTGFDGIISALEAQRFDVIMSAMTITADATAADRLHPLLHGGHRHPGPGRQPEEHPVPRRSLRQERGRPVGHHPGGPAQRSKRAVHRRRYRSPLLTRTRWPWSS